MSPERASHQASGNNRWRRFPSFRIVLLGLVGVVAALWLAPTIAAFVADLDLDNLGHPYLAIGSFIVFDAIIPIFPSESLLTTGSNLAAQSGSSIELWKLMLTGSVAAMIGDSMLYLLSRTVLRKSMTAQVDKAQRNPKVARSLEVMSGTAPTLIVFGRFVPGLRFIVGATMGLSRYPYRRFLMYDAIGATFWASFTWIFSYLVATVIDDKPFLSIAVSVIVTTGLLALLYKPLKNSWEQAAPVATH